MLYSVVPGNLGIQAYKIKQALYETQLKSLRAYLDLVTPPPFPTSPSGPSDPFWTRTRTPSGPLLDLLTPSGPGLISRLTESPWRDAA